MASLYRSLYIFTDFPSNLIGREYEKNALRILRKSGPDRPLDPCHRPEGSWALGTRMKVWSLVEGTICNPGTIAERTKCKQNKYVDLRLGIKNLYPCYKVRLITIVFF